MVLKVSAMTNTMVFKVSAMTNTMVFKVSAMTMVFKVSGWAGWSLLLYRAL